MEGAPLTNTADSEDNFAPKKTKTKRERFDSLEDDAAALHRRRHIAREVVRHEEAEREPLEARAARLADRVLEHRRRAPEATQLHGEERSREHIGHMLVSAESRPDHRETARPHHVPEKAQLRPGTRVESLSRSELLSFSEHITVETTSLRNVYETHLIGEQALRRLIAEYLEGHDIHAALQREILEHEIDFERDPGLRDSTVVADNSHRDTTQLIAPGKDALNQLLQKAQSVIGVSDSDDFSYAQDHQRKTDRPASTGIQRRPIDVIMAVTIILLVILVLLLLFGRH